MQKVYLALRIWANKTHPNHRNLWFSMDLWNSFNHTPKGNCLVPLLKTVSHPLGCGLYSPTLNKIVPQIYYNWDCPGCLGFLMCAILLWTVEGNSQAGEVWCHYENDCCLQAQNCAWTLDWLTTTLGRSKLQQPVDRNCVCTMTNGIFLGLIRCVRTVKLHKIVS